MQTHKYFLNTKNRWSGPSPSVFM